MCWAQKISKILGGIASRVMCFVLGLGWRKEAKQDAGDKKDGPGPHSRPRPRRGKKKSKQSFDREVEENAEGDSKVTIMKAAEENDVAEREVAEKDDVAVADEEEAAERKEVVETVKKRVADEEEAAEREEVMETAKKRPNEESQGGVRRRKQRRGDQPERNATMVLTPSPQPPPRLSTAYWDFTQYGKGQRNIFRLHNPPQSSAQDPNYIRGLFAEESDNGREM